MCFRSWRSLARFVVLACSLSAASAVVATSIDVYSFPDQATEDRYRDLIEEFRCPKCLNTNLAGSDAPIAQDLRRTVHRLLVSDGYSDDEIRDYLHARYGDFVLYDPPLTARTAWLWLAPGLFAAIGVALLVRARQRSRQADALDDDERARLAALLPEESPQLQGQPGRQGPAPDQGQRA